MEWSDEKVIKLIDSYREKSLLWDPQHKEHFKKPLKEDAWRDIAAVMDVPKEQCKKKIISLLSSYRREKSKIKNSQGTEKGRDEIYVSRWFAYDAFKFLDDRDVPRKRLMTENDDISENAEEMGTQCLRETTATASSFTNRPSKRAKGADDANSAMVSSAFNILKNAAEKLDTEPVKPNEIDAFFTYVSTKVKKYSCETQTAVQHAVFEILMKADRGYYNWAATSFQNSNFCQNPAENELPSVPPAASSQQYVLQPLNRVPTAMESPFNSPANVSSQPSPSESIMSEHFADFV